MLARGTLERFVALGGGILRELDARIKTSVPRGAMGASGLRGERPIMAPLDLVAAGLLAFGATFMGV